MLIPRTLPTRVAVISSVLVGLLMTVFFVVAISKVRVDLEQRVTKEAADNAKRFASFTLGYFFYQDNMIHLETQQKSLSESPNVLYSYIVSAEDKIVMGVQGLESFDIGLTKQTWEPSLGSPTTEDSTIFEANQELATRFFERLKTGDQVTLLSLPLNCAEQMVKCAYLKVAVFPESHLVALSNLMIFLGILGVVITLLSGAIVYLVLRTMLVPISILTKQLAEFSALQNFNLDEVHQFKSNEVQEIKDLKTSLGEFSKVLSQNALNSAVASTTQMLAHDVKKPFSMFKMLIDNVQSAGSTEAARQIMSESLPEVNQSLASVEGLLQDVMQIGADTMATLENVSPESLIESSLGELFRVYPDADVSIEYALFHSHCVQADTLKIGRVFANILGNAVQAMAKKGPIWIHTKETGQWIEFVLGNAGSVIPQENLERLFDAFFTSGKKGGTGLGLAIAKKAIELHQGTIFCRSAKTPTHPNGYVEFVFTLPMGQIISESRSSTLPAHSTEIQESFKKHTSTSTQDAIGTELEGELERKVLLALERLDSRQTLLVVDDEAVYRNGLVSLVARSEDLKSKLNVVVASNSQQAMQLCKAHEPLLILQDVDLGPGSLTGIEIIAQLRKEKFKGHICVHSNRFLHDDNKNAMAAGANFVIPKPMGRAHLLRLLLSSIPSANVVLNDQRNVSAGVLPKIIYVDDSATFLFGFKRAVGDRADVFTFKSSTALLQKIQSDDSFLNSVNLIVTDYFFETIDPLNGLSLASQLREMGYLGPIVLASDAEVNVDKFKKVFNGRLNKGTFEWHDILGFLASLT